MTPAGTSNELDVQNEWEKNTHTHKILMTFHIKIDLNVARPFHLTSLVHIAAMYCLPSLMSVRTIAAMFYLFTYILVFIIVSIVPCVFHAHRITDSKTSQPRQPQLFVYCLPKCSVFPFIILHGYRFVKSILSLTSTMATMPLLPTESNVSCLKNTQHILRPTTPSCTFSIFNFRGKASTDTLLTLSCFILLLLLTVV